MRAPGDVDAIVALAAGAHAESRFGDIPFAPDKVERIARRAFDDTKRHGIMMGFRHGVREVPVYVTSGVDVARSHRLAERLGFDLMFK
jgi:hypothetical protein